MPKSALISCNMLICAKICSNILEYNIFSVIKLRYKEHKPHRLYILHKSANLENESLKRQIKDRMNSIEEQITKEKLFSRYSKLYRMQKMTLDNAKNIITVSQLWKIEHIVKLWNESEIKRQEDIIHDTIYKEAMENKFISPTKFSKWSQWCRFNMMLSDKGRNGVYCFKNHHFISRIPLWFPPGYTDFKKLPASHNPFLRPNENITPTNYVIRLSGIEGSFKLNEKHDIILTDRSANICVQYRQLKLLKLEKVSINDDFFVNAHNKPLARLQKTQGSLLHKMELATGVEDVTVTTIRQSAESMIQSNEDMKAVAKQLNSHSASVGFDFYNQSQVQNKAEFVNYAGILIII